jgi:two-component system, NarL family, nitrate/nitrite response regulator NarL
MNEGVRILLIDDHTIFRESLLRLLAEESGFQVVGHCATLAEARKILSETLVHVVLLDYDLDGEAGTKLLKYLNETESTARALMLTAGMMASATLDALDAGAAGVILKHSGTRQLLQAIDRVSRGEVWWDTGILRSALSRAKDTGDRGVKAREVTIRQRTVLRYILDGLTNKEIADRIDASETAVKASIQELFSKAGVRTRSQLVRVAIEQFSADWLPREN